jgi:UDP-N-acetylglucosamine:LPS N-acetylglucosamine transferase
MSPQKSALREKRPGLPTVILATSNGVGMGHLARASAIAQDLIEEANVVIVSMAGAVAEVGESMGIPVEYIPGRDRGLMPAIKWDAYLRDRLVALIDETNAVALVFDGVVPYPGVIAARSMRPRLKLIWMRRGLWQQTPQKHLLPLQSRLMDLIIEPGDFAFEYDHGPTSKRHDAKRIAPVTLYKKDFALARARARKKLGLNLEKPAVLVQMGTGDLDFNSKLTAALRGLQSWRGVQVVMTKEPVDSTGKSLIPEGMNVHVVRYFPLADVLHAFDGAVAAAGYNSVHELLPAGIPTVFVPNVRGTDNQEARARWCADYGFALYANPLNPNEITRVVRLLRDANVRRELIDATSYLPSATGAAESMSEIMNVVMKSSQGLTFRGSYFIYLLRTQLSRRLRFAAFSALRHLSLLYRMTVPRVGAPVPTLDLTPPIFSQTQTSSELRPLIKSQRRFEHVLTGASSSYWKVRQEIAARAFGSSIYIHTDDKSEQEETVLLANRQILEQAIR